MAIVRRRPPPELVCHSDRGTQIGFKESLQHCRSSSMVRAQ
jgi:hypothetical protein